MLTKGKVVAGQYSTKVNKNNASPMIQFFR